MTRRPSLQTQRVIQIDRTLTASSSGHFKWILEVAPTGQMHVLSFFLLLQNKKAEYYPSVVIPSFLKGVVRTKY